MNEREAKFGELAIGCPFRFGFDGKDTKWKYIKVGEKRVLCISAHWSGNVGKVDSFSLLDVVVNY